MVKFRSKDDSEYVRVARYILKMAKNAPAKVEANWDRELKIRSGYSLSLTLKSAINVCMGHRRR
jgi:hypothetical protein